MIKVFRSRKIGMTILLIALASSVLLAFTFGKGANAQSSSKCTDSDSGNIYVKGTAKRDVNSATDMCGPGSSTIPPGRELIERNCVNDWVQDEHINCPGGCSNGACLAYYDTDGKDYFTKGTTFYKEAKFDEESCLNGTRKEPQYRTGEGPYLFEIWVEKGVVNSEAYKCPNGCNGGVCVEKSAQEPKPECSDSDGGRDYSVQGETTDFGDTRKDSCFDSNTVTEFYCEQAEGQTRPSRGAEQKSCEYGCKDGACVQEPTEEDTERIENQKKTQELLNGTSGMSGMLRGVNAMEKAFLQLAKQEVAMPSELEQTINRVKEIGPDITKFQNKKAENVTDEEAETLADNLSELCEIGPTLEEWGDQVPQFLQLGAKMKQALKDLKKAKTDVARAAKAAARSKFDISDKADELNWAFETLNATMNDAKTITDLNEKDGKISEFYDQFQDIYDTIGVINALQNTAKAKTEWTKLVKKNTGTISQLARAGSDVSELTAKNNDEIKTKLDELTVALKQKPIDRYEIKWFFEDLKSRQAEFTDIADQLRGVNSALPKVQTAKFDTSQFKNFGAFSQFCGVQVQNDTEEEVLPENE